MVVGLTIYGIHCARSLIIAWNSWWNQQNTTVEMSVHLTYVLNGVIQVTVVSNGAATKIPLVFEADIFWKGREYRRPSQVAMRSRLWVWGRTLAGVVGSNPIGVIGCLSLVSVVCYLVEVSASGRSLVQGSLTECGVSKWVWSWSFDDEEALVR